MFQNHVDDLGASCMAAGVWLLAQAAELPPMIETALENSAWAALVFFFVWTSWKREERLGARIDELERQTPALLERVLAAMDRNTDAVAKLDSAMDKLKSTVEKRQ